MGPGVDILFSKNFRTEVNGIRLLRRESYQRIQTDKQQLARKILKGVYLIPGVSKNLQPLLFEIL